MQDDEKKIYYDIVVRCWVAFSKKREQKEHSDEWWDAVIADFEDIRILYTNTDYANFVGKMIMSYLDEHERRYRRNGKAI